MKLRNAIPMLLAGVLIPAWGLCQGPPAQPQTQPAPSQGSQADKTTADKAAADKDKVPQGKRSFHHHPPLGGWRAGDANAPNRGGRGMSTGREPGGPPPGGRRGGFPPMFDTLAKMSPEERNKALESDPNFSRLPPQRQAQLRERLERYSAMTPEQRQSMRDRFDI